MPSKWKAPMYLAILVIACLIVLAVVFAGRRIDVIDFLKKLHGG